MTNNLSAGNRVKALDFPRAWQVYHNTTISNVTSTTYETGNPEVSVRVMAPSTGRVAVALAGGTRNNGANADRILVTYKVYEGDPADNVVRQGADLKRGITNPATQGDQFQYHGHVTMVDGLIPGQYYFFQVQHRTTLGSGTADISHRCLLVWPIP